MKKKKVILISLLFILLSVFTFNFAIVRADSGWDSDYDSSSSSSSSSWSSDWSDSGGSSDIDNDVIAFIFFILLIIYFIFWCLEDNSKLSSKTIHGNTEIDHEISEEEVQKYISNFNKDDFLNDCYQKFIDVQNAWSEFDYDKLRSLLSDELYNSYHNQLLVLKKKKQKNIMNDFEEERIIITDLNFKNKKLILSVNLIVSFYDYLVDKDNNVIRGRNDKKLTNSYNLVFTSTINNKKMKKTCPSCGASLPNEVSNVCPYCKNNIVFESHDWILSKKEIRK